MIEYKLMKDVKFNIQLAIIIAKEDCNIGVSSAMDLLSKWGFDCSYYFKTMNNYCEEKEIDFDQLNLETRDKQYSMLGIKEVMDQAYELIEVL